MTSRSSVLVRWTGSGQHELALICIPWAGAGAVPFRAWGPMMDGVAAVYAVRLAGREARFGELPSARIGPVVDEVTAAVAALPHTRVALLGHCSGAVIAYEVAKTLRSLRAPALARLIVVAQQAPRDLAASSLDVDPTASIPVHFLSNPEFAEILIPILAADMKMISDYEYHPAEPLDVPITVICGSRDEAVAHEELAGWREETSRATNWLEVDDADHLFSGDAWLKLGSQVRAELE